MNHSAIYHRPESEYAFLQDKDTLVVRIRTEKEDMVKITCIFEGIYVPISSDWEKKSVEMKKLCTTDSHDYWVATIQEKLHRSQYGFILTDRAGKQVFYGDRGVLSLKEKPHLEGNNYFKMPYYQEIDRFKAPQWVKETVWYQIFPERFANGDKTNDPKNVLPWASKTPGREDFFGGDLQGIIDHLDYLEDLGITGIYFCPIFEAHSNHKYDTIDYFKVDPAFGNDEVFKRLVEECHKRGIKVMLDAVFNHIGDTSPQWQDVLKNGEKSKYVDWFHIHEFPVSYKDVGFDEATDLTYDVFAFTPHMPKLNTANPEVIDYLLEIATYWIEKFDIDAWRLDVANEVDHAFWKKFRKNCDRIKKDFYIIGEIWHSSQSWLNGDEFHAVMNYPYTGLIQDCLIKKKIAIREMVAALNHQLMLYRTPTNQMMFNVLDSHDTPRLLTETKGNKDLMKQVIALTYLQPATPCLYYGDEIGLSGGGDPECRKCMIWEEEKQDRKLYQFFQKIIQLRKEKAHLISEGELHWCVVNEGNGILQLERKLGDEQLIATFNTGSKPVSGQLRDVLLSNKASIQGEDVSILPDGFVISVS